MKTDCELLELAAKAAGYQIDGPASKYMVQGYTFDSLLRLNERGGHSVWNPLTNDGDALRLAVKLGITIVPNYYAEQQGLGITIFTELDDSADYCTPTRRAIVRVAAAMSTQA